MPDEHKELDALAAAMNRSAERLQTLWFTFLAVTLYFAISAFTTTHQMLLLEEGQTLPVLDVKLPLLPFYIIAPTFYVVLHAYILMMLVLLARTAKTFEDALTAPGVMIESDRERYRMRLENALFLQIIVGARRERTGANGLALRTIALITLAVAPVLLLLLFQLMFLPYHSEAITWWHRFLVFADLVLVWTLWPSYRCSWGERMLPRLKPVSDLVTRTAASIAVLVFSVLFATFPSEEVHAIRIATPADPVLFGGPAVGDQARRGIFPNRLWLPNEDFVDDEKLKRLLADNSAEGETRPAYTVVLAGRNLVAANLQSVDLRLANFERAIMVDAFLPMAWLSGASFESADLRRAELLLADLQGANFYKAYLQGASLGSTRSYGASFSNAHLQGAGLMNAQLQGARFEFAQLQLAILMDANLQGASLQCAQLAGAALDGVNLRGASLRDASVWGATGHRASVDSAILAGLSNRPVCGEEGSDKDNKCRDAILKGVVPRSLRSNLEDQWQTAYADAKLITHNFWSRAQEAHGSTPKLANVLLRTMCTATGAPYVLRQILHGDSMHFLEPDEVKEIKSVMREAARQKADHETECPGAKALTTSDLTRFDRWLPDGRAAHLITPLLPRCR